MTNTKSSAFRFLGAIAAGLALVVAVGCGRANTVAPTDTSARVTAAPAITNSTAGTFGITATATASLPIGSPNVPNVLIALCQFTTGNPYPCCQNSVGQYGNCTGGAWEKAKQSWGIQLPQWGDAGKWATAAAGAGYVVDSTPTSSSIGVSTSVSANGHVAFITSASGASVSTYEQQCGSQYRGGWLTEQRPASYFNAGYIHAPIPTATIMAWSGALSTTGGTLTVKRGLFGSAVSVNFGFSLLRSNFTKGSSTYQWTIAGSQASTAGTFAYNFSKAGTFPITVTVTNGLGLKTVATATVVVQ